MKTTLNGNSITIDFTAEEIAVLDDDILDLEDWVDNFLRMKIAANTKRLAKNHLDRVLVSGTGGTIPASRDELAALEMQEPDYKNAKQRKAEADGLNG